MLKKTILLITACCLGVGIWYGFDEYNKHQENIVKNHIEKNFSFESVLTKAKKLASEAFQTPVNSLPEDLLNLSYDDYRDIRFVRENGPWYGQNLPYEIQFFHLGNIFQISVPINEVVDGVSQNIQYSSKFFNYGKNQIREEQLKNLGYAGFRIHSPLNTSAYFDELVTFLGASYFRGLAKKQKYGLSARGLAIDTAEMTGEEFPIFKEFWIEKPKIKDKYIQLYALLDSKSVVGAYKFKIIPGTNTIMDIEANLFTRANIKKLGIAPLTSMFLFGENNKHDFDDYRPEVHDSDGLLIHNGNDEWLWRPLDNSKHLRISSFLDNNPKGFGLLQRDREARNYLDFEANYQDRPSAWVEPLSDWGKGLVQLVEIPSLQEIHDNIVAYWVPEEEIKANHEYKFAYRLIWLNDVMKDKELVSIIATRTGIGGVSGINTNNTDRKFVIDFSGKILDEKFTEKGISPEVSAIKGKINGVSSVYNPITKGVTVYVDYQPVDGDEIRVVLKQDGKAISEVWSYQWLN